MILRYITLLTLLTYTLLAVEIKMGSGIFNPQTKGLIFYQNNLLEGSQAVVDNTAQYHGYFWSDFELSLPYKPHILAEYTRMSSSGISAFTLQTNFDLTQRFVDAIVGVFNENGESFLPLPSVLSNDMYDFFFYYDIYDDGIFPILSMGGGLKTFNYTFYVQVLNDFSIADNGGTTIPMLYTKIHQDIPKYFTYLEVGMKYYVFGDSDIYDLVAKMSIKAEVYKGVKGGIEFGYKDSNFHVKGGDIDNVAGNMRYKGLIGGVTFSF